MDQSLRGDEPHLGDVASAEPVLPRPPGDDASAAPVRPRRNLRPTAAERDQHSLTHVPSAWWCRWCVQGRADDEVHPRYEETEGPPVVMMDYSFFKSA
eukprot:11161566-Heterocapsa_arctica.AAC.1